MFERSGSMWDVARLFDLEVEEVLGLACDELLGHVFGIVPPQQLQWDLH